MFFIYTEGTPEKRDAISSYKPSLFPPGLTVGHAPPKPVFPTVMPLAILFPTVGMVPSFLS